MIIEINTEYATVWGYWSSTAVKSYASLRLYC